MTRPPVDRKLQLQIVFSFMTIYALVLSVIRPDPTTGQVIFRAVSAVIGIVGFIMATRR